MVIKDDRALPLTWKSSSPMVIHTSLNDMMEEEPSATLVPSCSSVACGVISPYSLFPAGARSVTYATSQSAWMFKPGCIVMS